MLFVMLIINYSYVRKTISSIMSYGRVSPSLTSLDVIELRLWGGVVLRWGRRGFDPSPGFSGGPKLRGGLAGPKRLLLNPGLDLTAALCPVKHTHNRCDFTWIYLRVT